MTNRTTPQTAEQMVAALTASIAAVRADARCMERLGKLHCDHDLGHSVPCSFTTTDGECVGCGGGIYIYRIGSHQFVAIDEYGRGDVKRSKRAAVRNLSDERLGLRTDGVES